MLTARRDGNGDGNPEYYYYLGDDLHNVMAITDAEGTVVERYEYGDYGQPVDPDPLSPNYLDTIAGPTTPGADPSTIGNPYLFNGRRFDPETGLYWYRTRYLDPMAGRFTSRDTIGIWGDPAELGNGYAYVGNNPWTKVDPSGLSSLNPPSLAGAGFTGKEIIDILGGVVAVVVGVKSWDEWKKHKDGVERGKDLVRRLKELRERLKKKKHKDATDKAIREEEAKIKGHEKEIQQKWPDGEPPNPCAG